MVHSESGSCQGIASAIPQVVRSAAPRAERRNAAAPQKNKTHLASVSGRWDSGALTISNLSAHSSPHRETGHTRTPGIRKLSRRRLRPFVTVIPKSEATSIRHGYTKVVHVIVPKLPPACKRKVRKRVNVQALHHQRARRRTEEALETKNLRGPQWLKVLT